MIYNTTTTTPVKYAMRQRDTATFHDTAEEMTDSSALKHVAVSRIYFLSFLSHARLHPCSYCFPIIWCSKLRSTLAAH